jgi:type II secretory pathway component PulJ
MGFSTLIDILGSTIVGGLLLLILLRLNEASTENTYVYGGDLLVQQNLVSVVELMEYDFRKIGYCKIWENIPDPSKAILFADSNRITFLTDERTNSNPSGDGIVDTMSYFLGPASELSGTANPRDRMLYRVVNGQSLSANLGITQFKLQYFDALGDSIYFPIAVPSEIYTMEINLKVENVAAYDENYSSAFWKQIRLAARNLRNR